MIEIPSSIKLNSVAPIGLMMGVLATAAGGCSSAPSEATARPPKAAAEHHRMSRLAEPALRGPYFGLEPPGQTPQLLAPGVVSTGLDDLNAAFLPDMSEFLFSVNMPRSGQYFIMQMRQVDGRWTQPRLASFSGQYSDADPAVAMDGQTLYFISKRPRPGRSEPSPTWQIWRMDREEHAGWGSPTPVGVPVNGSHEQIYVSVAADHSLYYSSRAEDGAGGLEIYRNLWRDGSYGERERLGPAINGAAAELNPVVAPDQSFVIFASNRGASDPQNFDLYVSHFEAGPGTGRWTVATPLPESINSPQMEYCPMLSPDGKFLFYSSYRSPLAWPSSAPRSHEDVMALLEGPQNGLGDVYWVDISAVPGL